MPPLNRTFALSQMHSMSVTISQYLELHMARLNNQLLQKHALAAKRAQRLAFRPRQRLSKTILARQRAHPLAAAAIRWLQHHRKANAPRLSQKALCALIFARVAGHRRHTGSLGNLFSRRL